MPTPGADPKVTGSLRMWASFGASNVTQWHANRAECFTTVVNLQPLTGIAGSSNAFKDRRQPLSERANRCGEQVCMAGTPTAAKNRLLHEFKKSHASDRFKRLVQPVTLPGETLPGETLLGETLLGETLLVKFSNTLLWVSNRLAFFRKLGPLWTGLR